MRILNRDQALEQISGYLGLNTFSDLRNQIIAEYLRHTVYLLSHTTEGIKPVYLTRLTHQVKRQLEPLWPTHFQADNLVRQILEHLNLIRDVAELNQGYWLPTPLRPIRLLSCRQILLIGGVATKTLQNYFGQGVKSAGFARYIKSDHLTENHIDKLKLEWQSFDSWLGESQIDDITTWIKKVLQQAKKQLKPSASDLTDFEVYKPEPNQDWQNHRWKSIRRLSLSPSEIVLCRFRQPPYYCLGTISMKQPFCLQCEANLNSIEISKLLYGLDAFYSCPTHAEYEEYQENIKLIFRNQLPETYKRLFLALGHDISKTPGKLPLVYELSNLFKKIVFNQLQWLGIELIKKS